MEIKIIEALQASSTPVIDSIFKVITHLGDVFFLALIFLIFYYAFNKKFALDFVICVGFVSVLNFGLKSWIKRPRPYVQSNLIKAKSYSDGFSFASGHSTAISSIGAGVIYANKNKKRQLWWICLICIVVSLLVGFSRMILGHHFLTDVITGLFLGYFMVPYLISLLQRINYQKLLPIALCIFGGIGTIVFVKYLFVFNQKFLLILISGALVGAGVGMILENRFVNFNAELLQGKKHIWWVTILAILGAAAAFLVLILLPKFGLLTYILSFGVGLNAFFVMPFMIKSIYKRLGDL